MQTGFSIAVGALILILSLSSAATDKAWADFKVMTPDVNAGELAVESVGDAGFDPNPNTNGERSYTAEVEYGITNWWQSELEFEFGRDAGPGQHTQFNQITSENLFQLTERGEYWLDAGFFAEYGHGMLENSPNETTFGPVLRKDFWGTSNSINLFIQKEFGTGASSHPIFLYAWETRVDAWEASIGRSIVVEPGFQYYGQPGPFRNFQPWNQQDQRLGPQLFGKIFDIGPGTLEWNGGVLFGLTSAVPRVTVRWQAEYEIHY
jgi:hypothetical protein